MSWPYCIPEDFLEKSGVRNISSLEIKQVSELQLILDKFRDLTDITQGEHKVTGSPVIPGI